MDRNVRFLLVEDNPDHAQLVRATFEMHRVLNQLDWVEDGELALAYLRGEGAYANRKRPHVVLLDLRLPKLSGMDTLAEIKADPALRDIPVVILTSSEAERDRLAAMQSYANSFVIKPVDFKQLSDVVNQLRLYWTVCDQSTL